jgi:hypothetical protein
MPVHATILYMIVGGFRRNPPSRKTFMFSHSVFLNEQFPYKIPNKRQGNPSKVFPGACAFSILSGRGVKFGFLA